MGKLSSSLLDSAGALASRIVDRLGEDVSVIVYGSVARGEEADWSDLDLLIISNKLRGNPLERLRWLGPLNQEHLPLEVIAYTRKEFLHLLDALSPTVLDASSEGLALYDDGFFAGARKDFEDFARSKRLIRRGRTWISEKDLEENQAQARTDNDDVKTNRQRI